MNDTTTETTIKLHRLEPAYAWAQCSCGNTVKFGGDRSVGCCPNCHTLWGCNGNIAEPTR